MSECTRFCSWVNGANVAMADTLPATAAVSGHKGKIVAERPDWSTIQALADIEATLPDDRDADRRNPIDVIPHTGEGLIAPSRPAAVLRDAR
jgi:hypothetical protein